MRTKSTLHLSSTFLILAAVGLTGCGGDQNTDSADAAEDYPNETITLIVPYGPGGSADHVARAVAEGLEDELDTTVVVENRDGGSGAEGMNALRTASPDGYTLAYVTPGTLVVTPLANDVGYTKDDFTPIGIMADFPNVLAVGADSPHADAEEFFEYAEENPGDLNIGTSGASTPMAIELERLNLEYGVDTTVIPNGTQAEAIPQLLGGTVDAIWANADPSIVEYLDSGEFDPIAVSTEERVSWLEEVPTLVELGYPDLTLGGSTSGLAAPADLPDPIRDTLESALEGALQNPTTAEAIGENYVPEGEHGSQELATLLDTAQEAYEPILGD